MKISGAVRGELHDGQFNWQLGVFGDIVERDSGDVMIDRVGVRDLFSNRDFDFERLAGLECREKRYDRHVLFSFSVGKNLPAFCK